MNHCESCGSGRAAWYLYDSNAEVTLCTKCVRQLREMGEQVERLPAQ